MQLAGATARLMAALPLRNTIFFYFLAFFIFFFAECWHSAKQKKLKIRWRRVQLAGATARLMAALPQKIQFFFYFLAFFYFFLCRVLALGKAFAECPIKNTWQRPLCRPEFCRVLFAECHTRQRLCRVYLGLCRMFLTLGNFFYFFLCRVLALGKAFAECPIKNTRQRPLCRPEFCRVLFAECGTRQRLCRVYLGLCRMFLTLGKASVPCSE